MEPWTGWGTTACVRMPVRIEVETKGMREARDCFSSMVARRSAVRESSTDIMAFAGMKKGKMVASSEGRKADRMRPVPLARGLPEPARGRVSVPSHVSRRKVYSLRRRTLVDGSKVDSDCISRTVRIVSKARYQRG